MVCAVEIHMAALVTGILWESGVGEDGIEIAGAFRQNGV